MKLLTVRRDVCFLCREKMSHDEEWIVPVHEPMAFLDPRDAPPPQMNEPEVVHICKWCRDIHGSDVWAELAKRFRAHFVEEVKEYFAKMSRARWIYLAVGKTLMDGPPWTILVRASLHSASMDCRRCQGNALQMAAFPHIAVYHRIEKHFSGPCPNVKILDVNEAEIEEKDVDLQTRIAPDPQKHIDDERDSIKSTLEALFKEWGYL